MWSQRKEFRRDPTSTTNAGGSPDPPVLSHHHPDLPALYSRVCPTLRQATGPTRCRAHPPVPVIPDQREEGVAVHLHPDGLRTAFLLWPYLEPQNLAGTYSISPARKKAAADPEPRGSESAIGGA